MLNLRVLDLDGSLTAQSSLFPPEAAAWVPARLWGPQIRLACTFGTFERFRRWLDGALETVDPGVTLYGSGDFHHVSLALLKRLPGPFNLLVLDKHPDWMRGIPFLHCGTWLRHALRLPNLNRVFHCGGELDFDNAYRWLAPWHEIKAGRVAVFPAQRQYVRGRWAGITVHPLLREGVPLASALNDALRPFRDDLSRLPLYISIDKDVLCAEDAAVNWDSGLLRLPEAVRILETFLSASEGRLAGADVLGDWSPIELGHWLNRLCDRLDHPSPLLDEGEAAARNSRANTEILRVLCSDS
ncbi:MAG: hypothetical protein ABSH35_31165 [Isosphaeraceae bacterium]|jgi:hypothetical protein